MALPTPEPGLVISYAYLWRHEHDKGHDEGRKSRPCVVVLSVDNNNGSTVVTVAPVTHREPTEAGAGVEIALRVKQHLGLDNDRSWVIVSEVNVFTWPGYDLRPIAAGQTDIDYGFLPPKLFDAIKAAMLDLIVRGQRKSTSRD